MDARIQRPRDVYLLLGGVLLAFIANFDYAVRGYSPTMVTLWLASLFLIGTYFFLRRPLQTTLPTWSDVLYIAGLLICFSPLYLAFVYRIPVQVNTDEIGIMMFVRALSTEEQPDLFGLSSYFQFPTFIFVVFGWLGEWLDGIDLLNMRLVHASFGVATIVVSYGLFRLWMGAPLWAATGAVIVGANHSLLSISRMAMRDNTALFVEVCALLLLSYGFKYNNRFVSFVGGLVAGLSFYTYAPGRMVILIWGLFLVLALFRAWRSGHARAGVLQAGIAGCLGLLLMSWPLIVAIGKTAGDDSFSYQRQQILIFPEARELQRRWVNAETVDEGLAINLRQGLGAFNNRVHDHGYIYVNSGHSLVDPLTGVLLWAGLLIVVVRLVRERGLSQADTLFASAFLLIWLFCSFLTTKNPNYTRLLISLPFVAYLVVTSIRIAVSASAQVISAMAPRVAWSTVVYTGAGLCMLVILAWNMTIYSDFVSAGLRKGNDVGGTARYVEERNHIPGHSFYLMTDSQYPYYSWGQKYQWESWFGSFAGRHQTSEVVPANAAKLRELRPPFTVMMQRGLWRQFSLHFRVLYPDHQIHNIVKDASLIAVEVGAQ